MAQVRVARFFHGVVVDVDHVVEHAHRGRDGALEFVVVEFLSVGAFDQVLRQIDRAEVTDRGFGVAGVQRDFSAQIR